MSESKSTSRNWLQFRLQTLLVLMLVAAGVCAWLLRPKQRELSLAGGAMRITESYRRIASNDVPSMNAAWNRTGSEVVVVESAEEAFTVIRTGFWALKDADEQLLITGRYWKDQPHGKWTIYHPNGQVAMQGRTAHGRPLGRWQAWNRNGTRQADVHYGGPAEEEVKYGSSERQRGSAREGGVRIYDQDGTLWAEGQIQDDQREGHWEFYADSGKLITGGSYLQGQRHGPWEDGDYVHGRKVEELDRVIAEAAKGLASDNLGSAIVASRKLAQIGEAAVGVLVESVEHSKNDDRRLLAIRALGTVGEPAISAIEALKPHADSDNLRIRVHALRALMLIDTAHAKAHAGRLQDAVGVKQDARLFLFAQFQILDHCLPLRPRTFQRLLQTAAETRNPVLREEIAFELARRVRISIEQLTPLLKDSDESVRWIALEVLIRLSDDAGVVEEDELRELYAIPKEDESERIRQRVEALPAWQRGDGPRFNRFGPGFF